MPFDRVPAAEGGGGDGDVEMAAFTRAGVTGMPGAVVADVELSGRERGLERGAQPGDPVAHDAFSRENSTSRSIHAPRLNVTTMPTGPAIQTLKNTQSASLRLSATQMLATPSKM